MAISQTGELSLRQQLRSCLGSGMSAPIRPAALSNFCRLCVYTANCQLVPVKKYKKLMQTLQTRRIAAKLLAKMSTPITLLESACQPAL